VADPTAVITEAEARRAGHSVQLEAITHRFGATTAVDDVSLPVEAGELVALLGPSGCGKTTLLRIIGGFIVPTAGRVRVDGRSIDHLPASRRDIGVVFQNYALFPHMTVYENVAYGLRARHAPRERIRERVARMLATVQLEALAERMPRQLSGGQQQRVALARALAVEPRILLLDEPFGALDKNLRLDMQIEVKRLQRQFGITAILVTHDQEEAMSLADRIAVMHRGRVEQFASPVEVYDRPRTLFVNSFVGTANLLAGEIVARESGMCVVALDAGVTVDVPGEIGSKRIVVSARPENLRLFPTPGPGRWPVEVRIRMPVGAQTVSEVVTRTGESLKVTEPRESLTPPGEPGAAVYCGIVTPSAVSLFPAPAAEPATA
jgi:putative spermidine/putrescine transport system ATP-binding protein